MKAILLSVQPKWLKMILNGEKTIEIRKTIPKCELPIDVYIYETLGTIKKYCDENSWGINNPKYFLNYYTEDNKVVVSEGMGQVVAKFSLNKYTFVPNWEIDLFEYFLIHNKHTKISHCLELKDVYSYADGKDLYYWHIEDLQIFDKPMELGEFYKVGYMPNAEIEFRDRPDIWLNQGEYYRITKPPQSWQYVEVVE